MDDGIGVVLVVQDDVLEVVGEGLDACGVVHVGADVDCLLEPAACGSGREGSHHVDEEEAAHS
ncbi:hypothetical protein [Promicromonospora soli]|uniref:Uncharacterized protein n=1 Tax=Promicromonospora soli TaxID=2035533 RepID=A0A919FLB2_9MICO|nr:hypothetical protein [Promicromonospora soli]GHH67202.1 hypothetical protein GCM10017772_08440 [Promicromonospora soli]